MLFSLLVFCFACGTSTPGETTTEAPASATGVNERIPYCFRNIFPYQDGSDRKDVEEMYLTVQGNQVMGSLIWFPAEKDLRRGQVEGTINNGVMTLTYLFSQEGQTNSVELTATLLEDAIKIRSALPELGISEQIKKVPCE